MIICIVDNPPEIDSIKAAAACALLISVLRISVCNILAIEHSQCKLYLVYYMAKSAGCGSMEDFSTWLRMKEVCNILRVNKTRATPYHPQSDGLIERFNRTLLSMLSTTHSKKLCTF